MNSSPPLTLLQVAHRMVSHGMVWNVGYTGSIFSIYAPVMGHLMLSRHKLPLGHCLCALQPLKYMNIYWGYIIPRTLASYEIRSLFLGS